MVWSITFYILSYNFHQLPKWVQYWFLCRFNICSCFDADVPASLVLRDYTTPLACRKYMSNAIIGECRNGNYQLLAIPWRTFAPVNVVIIGLLGELIPTPAIIWNKPDLCPSAIIVASILQFKMVSLFNCSIRIMTHDVVHQVESTCALIFRNKLYSQITQNREWSFHACKQKTTNIFSRPYRLDPIFVYAVFVMKPIFQLEWDIANPLQTV